MTHWTRRSAVKLASLGALGGVFHGEPPAPTSKHADVPRWEIFELTLHGPQEGNPFRNVQLSSAFTQGNRTVKVEGFYDGSGVYKVRFMPDTEGAWTYRTTSNRKELEDHQGSFLCTPAKSGVHGPVSVRNIHHFAYADGTPFYPFGTTCYAWIHQSEALQQQTLETLRQAPFNKIRMCVFPKHYEYNHNEPPFYPFERDASGKSDFTRPNPAFYRHLEERITNLRELGIEADLILFHPYDRWGYSSMPAVDDDAYVRYAVARLASHRNLWWSLANEYDFMKAKTPQDFDRLFQIVQTCDPSSHLRSIHHGAKMYDYSRPWVTHASLQTTHFEEASTYLKSWIKPVVFDEVMYEGNLNRRWGNLSGEEMVIRFWRGVIAGCYVTHGETLLDPSAPPDEEKTPTLWWAHGGALHGTSPGRIAFLRRLVEQSGQSLMQHPIRTGFEAEAAPYYDNATVFEQDEKTASTLLYFFDFHQPIWYEFPLPEGTFTAEQIDPWKMTITPLPGRYTGKSKIKLTGTPYQAMRFRRVS